MTERIIDLSEEGASLSVRHAQLVIQRDDNKVTVPLNELAALVVAHPAVHYTHAVLTGICAQGGAVVLCNEKRMPTGMLLPIEAHFTQAERFAEQASASLPTKKRLWKQLVRAKVTAQGRLLQEVKGDDRGLAELANRVRSGDPSNIEAQASRRYWPALFGEDFTRDPDLGGVNSLLNYGYAVLRAMVARAICAAGLHPSLGLHHHNRYNPFCLADDLMEPFRPVVDNAVFSLAVSSGDSATLSKYTKRALIKALTDKRFTLEVESRTLFGTLAHLASSLADVYAGERKKLFLPRF
ncbi:type II CRISPR-associated endonuclease Cas1 [bacterium]|nr:type II CRISPR-associated endonuclease Cas1 [bacterium]